MVVWLWLMALVVVAVYGRIPVYNSLVIFACKIHRQISTCPSFWGVRVHVTRLGRDAETHEMVEDRALFPGGMKALGDWIHAQTIPGTGGATLKCGARVRLVRVLRRVRARAAAGGETAARDPHRCWCWCRLLGTGCTRVAGRRSAAGPSTARAACTARIHAATMRLCAASCVRTL